MVTYLTKKDVENFMYNEADLRPYERGFLIDNRDYIMKLLSENHKHAFCYKKANGNVIAIWNINEMWAGVGEWYSFLSKTAIKEYPITLCKIARGYRDYLINHGFRRIQSTVQLSNRRSVEWHKWLGFKVEGYLRQYGTDGDDYLIMSYIKGLDK